MVRIGTIVYKSLHREANIGDADSKCEHHI